MFESIRKLIAEFGDSNTKPEAYDANDYRLAAAALLVHCAAIDGNISDVERGRLHDVIKQRFKLDDEAAGHLIDRAQEADDQAIDLYQFTSRLNRALDDKQRARMVEMMWQVVYADGVVTEFESNLIWRAADLLHVSRDERIVLRAQVASEQAAEPS